MARRIVNLRAQPLLNVASYARRGPTAPPLSATEIDHIARTVRRVPEVIVKVSGGARTLRGVGAHLDYIGREGEGEIETDDGRTIQEKGFERELIEDWDLDLQVHRRYTERWIAAGRKPPKLVHNLVFSMPRGTPADKVLAAVRAFAREKFALKHRYATTLHTDQGHPHVHMVVKAVSEEGVRLNIRKATLREWRRDFARYLREVGIEANATERAVRGQTRVSKRDGIYRAMRRGESTYMQQRAVGTACELATGAVCEEPGKRTLIATRRAVMEGWDGIADLLAREQQSDLATLVRRYTEAMPPVRSEKEVIASQMLRHRKARTRDNRLRLP